MDDPDTLQRFVDAQAPVYERVRDELRNGRKMTHWMWFIFPQIRGLGSSPTSQFFAIPAVSEAEAYLAHPILGPRLRECCQILLDLQGRSAHEIFGSPDDLKLRSSMTMFANTASPAEIFNAVLARYFDGIADRATLEKL